MLSSFNASPLKFNVIYNVQDYGIRSSPRIFSRGQYSMRGRAKIKENVGDEKKTDEKRTKIP